MPIPSVESAVEDMRRALGGAIGNVNIAVQWHSAVVGAAVANETTENARNVVGALCGSIDALRIAEEANADASDRRAKELARFSQQTADATRGLRLATSALFGAMVLRILMMVLAPK